MNQTRARRSVRPWYIVLLSAVAAAVIVAGITQIGTATSTARTSTETVAAANGVVQATVSGSGNVEPGVQDTVNFQTSGTLTAIDVTVGQHVKKGQLLATLDPSTARLTLQEADTTLAAAQDQLNADEESTTSSSSSATSSTGSGSSIGSGSSAGSGSGSSTSDSTGSRTSATTAAGASTASVRRGQLRAHVGTLTTGSGTTTGAGSMGTATTGTGTATTGTGTATTGTGTVTTGSGTTRTGTPTATKRTQTPTTTKTTSGIGSTKTTKGGGTTGTKGATGSTGTSKVGSTTKTTTGSVRAAATTTTAATTSTTETALQKAQQATRVAQAKEQVQADKNTVKADEKALSETKLYAPATGTVASLGSYTVGDTISAGGSSGSSASSAASSLASTSSSSSGSSGASSGFAEIINDHTMTMTVTLSEDDISSVKLGQTATVSITALNGVELAGKVTSISPLGSSSNGVVSYDATITVYQSNPKVLPGMSATASIITAQQQGVTLPTDAISGAGTTGTVKLVGANGKTTTQTVTVGLRGSSRAVITSGLKAGDEVQVTITLPALGTSTTSTSSSSSATGFGGAGFGGGAFSGSGGFAGIRSALGGGGFAGAGG
ncbi:MAG: HlyD family efflux transporter periplasmic adaptor subunit [Solirubrobacteraceae bacterium]